MPRYGSIAMCLFVTACVIVRAAPARADADDFCAKIRNDDRLRPYDPALRPGFVRAYRRLFPNAKGGQSDAMLRAQGAFRCMDGKLVACFTGANLPCGKLDPARDSAGAEAFCRANPQAQEVPRVATGHAAEFTFRCQGTHAEVSGTAWTRDDRGFAKDLWAPLDLE